MTDVLNYNPHNKNQIRTETKKIFKNLNITDLEIDDLEIGIFNKTLDYASQLEIPLSWSCSMFIEIYINYARSIYSNLDSTSYIENKNLITKFKKRDFLPHELPYMQPEEIFPEKWTEIINKRKLRIKDAYEIKQVAMTDAIKCSRCHNNKISYYDMQCRSADEATTTFYNCLVCNHKWKY